MKTTKTLKKDITSGLFWNIIETTSLHGLKLLVSILLARLLDPSQFGIIGLLSLLMAISQAILDSGLGAALIQKKNATHEDFCSIFYFNIFTGSVLFGALCLAAPLIARFFDQPELIKLTCFMSLNFFFNGFGMVHSSMLLKKMRFKSLFKINFLAAVLSGIIAIILAYSGFGVWSIAFQSVLSTLFINIFLWIFNSWRPTLTFSINSVKTMYSFGSKLLASDILSKAFENLYQTLIGKFYTVADVGFYANARSLINALLNITNGSLSRVLFPSFSPLQNEEQKLKRGYQKTISYASFLHFPMMIGLWAIVDNLIPFLFTEKWLGSIPILKLFCLINLLYPLDMLNLNVLKVKGRTDLFLRITVIKKIFFILTIILTVRYGVMALLYGQLVDAAISFFINGYYTKELISYSTLDQLREVFPSLLLSVAMGLGMTFVRYIPIDSLLLTLLLQIFIGIGFYLALSLVFNASLVREVRNLFLNLINRTKPIQQKD